MARRQNDLEEERRSYSATFLFVVGLLLAGSVWSVWDDNISRRPWKKYQADFSDIEADRVRGEIKKEEERLAADPAYQDVEKKLAAAHQGLESGETAARLKQLAAQAAKQQVVVSEHDLALRIAKSKIEEAWYELEHALLSGHPTQEPKAHLDAVEQERRANDEALRGAEAKLNQITNEIAELRSEVTNLEKQRVEMQKERDRLTQKLDAIIVHVGPLELPKIPKIDQVVLGGFDRGNWSVPVDRVDRCQSCHSAVFKPDFDEEPNPYKSHPHTDLMLKHPVETFACTPCHRGQGAAVNSPEQGHGEVKFWPQPLLRGDSVEASCIGCHADTRHLPPAEIITKGQVLFEEIGCHGCHLTEGYDGLAKVGPSLKNIGAKADPSWLARWVQNPQAFRPHTRMPNFLFSEEQATSVAAYLLSSTKADSEQWLAAHPPVDGIDSSDAALVAKGQGLIDSLGCRGCHGLAAGESPAHLGTDKDIAPNLSSIAEKTDTRWIYHWIKDPRGYSHVARMPSLRLSDDEARAVASFLGTLGTKKPANPAVVAALADPQRADAGQALVRKYGCFGCHEITGMEKESRVGVELSTFGSKPIEELFFGNHTDIPFTWKSWTVNKLKEPRTYATDRIEQAMPKFFFSDDDIAALIVFLQSRVEEKIPAKYLASNTPRAKRIMEGRRLVARYNCVGCHIIEGDGGAIRARYQEAPNMAPPVLNGEGAKVQPEWLYGFLQQPVPLRPWLQVRMPTFGLSREETTALVEYFGSLEKLETPFFHVDYAKMSPEDVRAGELLATADYFSCFSCHQQGDKKPEGPPEGWAPDLGMAAARLNPEWIVRWLHNPQALQKDTKMPSFYPGGPEDVLGGDEERQIRALRDYVQALALSPAEYARLFGAKPGDTKVAHAAADDSTEED